MVMLCALEAGTLLFVFGPRVGVQNVKQECNVLTLLSAKVLFSI